MQQQLERISNVVWGLPVLLAIVLTGVRLTQISGFAQIRMFPEAMSKFIKGFSGKDNTAGQSGYRALCTALAATVGTGNIAGVAGAIAIGGPGVIFWMWVSAILGMITKFAEITLAIRYRKRDACGEYHGGPMYMIRAGMPGKFHFLAFLYCFFGVIASFGIGNMTQVNAVIGSVNGILSHGNCRLDAPGSILLGIFLAIIIWAVFKGGVGRIGHFAERLVPFAAGGYILLALAVLLLRANRMPDAILAILRGAFTPQAVTGGMIGSMLVSLRVGVSRGVFTNEAGMGTASIAHATANTSHPVEQGLLGVIEVFLDSIIICTLTGLVILCSGVTIPYGTDPGIDLTISAFSAVLGSWTTVVLTVIVSLLAFATIIGWGLYGARCAQYLFGDRVWNAFLAAQIAAVIIGAVIQTSIIWVFSEIVNGLMALPNLVVLLWLSPEFVSLLADYKKKAYSSH